MSMDEKELKKIISKHALWRKTNRQKGQQADLQGANLEGANLEGANLAWSSLVGANLKGANLEGAILEAANLEGANLQGAILEGTSLVGANLKGANLEKTDLRRANLKGANLQGAILEGTNLDFACWPMWCGSIGVKADDRLVAQLAFHLARLNVSACSAEIKADMEAIRKLKIVDKFCQYREDVEPLK